MTVYECVAPQQLSLHTHTSKAVMQFEITRKALANFSPGLERQRQPWVSNKGNINPERVRRPSNPFRVLALFGIHSQGSRYARTLG
jgi:hypothetical protein